MAWIQNHVNREIPDVQAGFRAGCGTRDQIVNLRLITEKAKEFGQSLFMCFIDYKKAFDMVSHNQLWISMIDMGFPPHMTDLIRSLYRKQQSAVRSAAGMTEWFKIGRGVRQGCILSPCLFNLHTEAAMREALEGYNKGFQIQGRVINNLRYADDVVLIATSPKDLQELINRVRASSEKVGLLINTDRTKVMACGNSGMNTKISLSGEVLEEVESFVYLGSIFTLMATVLMTSERGWQWEDRQCSHYRQFGKAKIFLQQQKSGC